MPGLCKAGFLSKHPFSALVIVYMPDTSFPGGSRGAFAKEPEFPENTGGNRKERSRIRTSAPL